MRRRAKCSNETNGRRFDAYVTEERERVWCESVMDGFEHTKNESNNLKFSLRTPLSVQQIGSLFPLKIK
jgi:hypothetical protein